LIHSETPKIRVFIRFLQLLYCDRSSILVWDNF